MSEVLDFGGVESAVAKSYLRPGLYTLSVSSVKLETPENKNPYINVSFTNKEGGVVSEKFFITVKALGRLQYLHEAWCGKKLDKMFASAKDLANYFERGLMSKKVERNMIVGGQYSEDGTKVYASLPYTNFIIAESQAFEEGEFEEGDKRWNEYVRKSQKTAATGTSSAILSDTAPTSRDNSADATDTPW